MKRASCLWLSPLLSRVPEAVIMGQKCVRLCCGWLWGRGCSKGGGGEGEGGGGGGGLLLMGEGKRDMCACVCVHVLGREGARHLGGTG